MGSINKQDPSAFVYADAGVDVASSAIGVNIGAYSTAQLNMGKGLAEVLSEYGSSAIEVSACVPVMVKNPISCRVGGTVTAYNPNSLSVSSIDSMCTTNATYAMTVDQGLMGSAFCPSGNVGQGTIVIGATSTLTHWLGSAMGLEVSHGIQDTFAVTCDVDATNVYEYRQVTLSLQGLGLNTLTGL